MGMEQFKAWKVLLRNFIRISGKKPSPLEKALAPDSLEPLSVSLTGAACMGMLCGIWISQYGNVSSYIPCLNCAPIVCVWPNPTITVKINYSDPFGKISKKRPPANLKEVQAAAPRVTVPPSEVASMMSVKPIGSRLKDLSNSAYDLFVDMDKDMPKLENVAMLTRTSQSRIAGMGRKGKLETSYKDGYALEGVEGGDGMEALAWGTLVNGEKGLQLKSPILSTSSRNIVQELEMHSEGHQRSTQDILAVIHSRTPGLRHAYQKRLAVNPGLHGKVLVYLEITPRGEVVGAAVLQSNHGDAEFDEALLRIIRTWRFSPIQSSGNDIVKVPFTFSE